MGTLVLLPVAAPIAAAPPTAAMAAVPGTANPVCRSVPLLVLGAPEAVDVVAPDVLVPEVGVGVLMEGLRLPVLLPA